jgi:hypothetical protein
MFKSIKLFFQRYDERFFAWLEGKGTTRSERERKASRSDHEGSAVSKRGVVPKRHAPQVPDPWD